MESRSNNDQVKRFRALELKCNEHEKLTNPMRARDQVRS